jgi:hypothetical protein
MEDDRERLSMNCEDLIKGQVGSLFGIDVFGDWMYIHRATEVIKNYENWVTFPVT